jgi:hypothetical protein
LVARQTPFDTSAIREFDWNYNPPRALSEIIDKLQSGASISGLSAILPNDPDAEGYIRLMEISGFTFTKI